MPVKIKPCENAKKFSGKISRRDVQTIKILSALGWKPELIAQNYPVSAGYIGNICRGYGATYGDVSFLPLLGELVAWADVKDARAPIQPKAKLKAVA